MKFNYFLLTILLLLLISCNDGNNGENSQNQSKVNLKPNLELSGSLTNSSRETLKLFYNPSGKQQLIDSAKVDEKGNFKFEKLHIPHTGFYTLKLSEQIFCPMILDSNQKIIVTGDAKNFGNNHQIEGSEDNKVFKKINNKIIFFRRTIDSLGADFQAKMGPNNLNKSGFNELSAKYEGIYNNITENFYNEMIKLINENSSSFACIAAAVQLDPGKYVNVCKNIYQNLSKKYPNNPTLNSFYDYVKKYGALTVGADAPDITLPNTEGKNFSLSSLKGKIVLIDFWASWCKPCIKDMPEVKKLYEKFKSKGFEILGVSLDENKDQWIAAISEYSLPWIHISDLGGWNSSAARTYDVNSIPFTILINKEGKIIQKGLRGAALEEELNKQLSK